MGSYDIEGRCMAGSGLGYSAVIGGDSSGGLV